MTVKICVSCQTSLNLKRGKYYCSNSCQATHELKIRIQKSELGLEKASHKTYRKYMLITHGNKCMKCNWSEINLVTGNVPIQMNHIDGNSENNKLSNLELLCPNCHSLTPNYGNLNKGNGRFSKRKRYQEGKSY